MERGIGYTVDILIDWIVSCKVSKSGSVQLDE